MEYRLNLVVSVTREELARALARGTLVIPLDRAAGFGGTVGEEPGGLDDAALARICAAYGPETLAANLLWEIAQTGETGANATELRHALGLKTAKALAGVFSGLGKTLAREVPGREHLFVERTWRRDAAEYHYRMPAAVRRAVTTTYG